MIGFRRRACWFAKRLLLLGYSLVAAVGLGIVRVLVFGQRMGKDKAEAQETHHDSHPMAEPALALRLLALSHCNLLSAL
jgi:hypothetical protein